MTTKRTKKTTRKVGKSVTPAQLKKLIGATQQPLEDGEEDTMIGRIEVDANKGIFTMQLISESGNLHKALVGSALIEKGLELMRECSGIELAVHGKATPAQRRLIEGRMS